jgi:hypothetical protein
MLGKVDKVGKVVVAEIPRRQSISESQTAAETAV